MMIVVWASVVVAVAAVLWLLRVMWSTTGRQLAKYKATLATSIKTVAQQNDDIERLRAAERKLREANQLLREGLRERERDLADRDRKIDALQQSLERQKAANERLSEIIGHQDIHIQQLKRDVEMLKNEQLKLRAQLGLAE